MSEIGERLQSLRKRAGYSTATDAARAFGWNENTYRSHENGERGIRPDIASKYARSLKSSLVWLLTGQGEEDKGQISRLAGLVNDNGIVKSWADQKLPMDIGVTFSIPVEAELLIVFTDTLYPRYSRGDILCIWKSGLTDNLSKAESCPPLEGVALLADGQKQLGLWRPQEASDILEVINRPPMRGVQVNEFLPVQIVLRLGTYAMMTYSDPHKE